MDKNEINFFGLTTFRNARKKFGIKTDDRRRHFYCLGKTGMGKSNLMENMAIQDIQAGRGIAYVDPHGEGAEKLLDFIPTDRINDVIFFNPADLDYPIAFNVMEKVDFRYRHLVAGGLMGVFKKVWPDVWSARMEYILNNSILALLEYPDSTILGVNRMLADVEYREKVVSKITDPIVKSFWVTEYARYTQRYEIEATAAIQNKVGQFISNPLIRNIVGQTKSTIDMRDIMDKEKIFIMDLSKGRIGEDNSRLLGALLITKLQLAAMSRVDVPEESRKDFYLYVDEFQNFATESFANILSEARKYRLNITLGHQYITQMEEEVRDAVFGNVGTLAVFRVGAEDAEYLEREFSPQFTAEDLVNLPKYNVYLKLMIDGIAGAPFSAETLPPPIPLENSNRAKIIRASRERYGIRREIVDEKIFRWSGLSEFDESGNRKSVANKNNPVHQQVFKGNLLQGRVQPDGQILYDAICSNCGKATKVVFPPTEGRAVYCKSCLKKIKASAPQNQQNNNKKPENPMPPRRVGVAETPQPPAERDGAVVENIYFHGSKKSNEQRNKKQSVQQGSKRKEINLSELRRALEETLQKKDEDEAKEPEGRPKEQNGTAPEPKDKLQIRIEREKEMDKVIGENESGKSQPQKNQDSANLSGPPAQVSKKNIINPGETVKL